jgi:hypothetical protein
LPDNYFVAVETTRLRFEKIGQKIILTPLFSLKGFMAPLCLTLGNSQKISKAIRTDILNKLSTKKKFSARFF